jgi:tetratricopeptide (TPR) repeat protein
MKPRRAFVAVRSSISLGVSLCGIAVAVACHKSAPVTPVAPAADPQAIALRLEQGISEGCYLCLLDVLHEYRTSPSSVQQAAAVERAATRAALLLLVRQKELGIPDDDQWAAAESIAAAGAGKMAAGPLMLEIVQALPWNTLGVGEQFVDRDRERRRATSTAQRDAWRVTLEPEWPRDDVAAYLYLSLMCTSNQAGMPAFAAVADAHLSSNVVQYRWATCTGLGEPTLRRLLAANPRFHEIHFFLSRYASTARRFAEAFDDLQQAWLQIPRFTAAAVTAAELALNGDDYASARDLSEAVLAVVPGHWRSVLNDVKALSSLERYVDATAAADKMIADGHWYLGDAYYWRAWNEYQLDRVTAGVSDVAAAKDFEASVRVFTLAGLFQMKLERWTDAKREFESALALSESACDVHLYLGHTYSGLTSWRPAAGSFEEAARCYSTVISALRSQIARTPVRPGDEWTARQVAKWQRELSAAGEQEHSAIYNAAVTFLNARLPEQARPYALQAEAFPSYTDRARALLTILDRPK